jgi:hypothetical protein
VQIVDEEEYGSAAIERLGHPAIRRRASYASGRGELRLFARAPGAYSIEERYFGGFPVYTQDELIRTKTIDKMSLLVENHDVRLYEIGVDSQDFVGLVLLLVRRRLSIGGLTAVIRHQREKANDYRSKNTTVRGPGRKHRGERL